uniref:Uncharacterized protein n=2 Tax=Opuntia streptacantha TaxID=393608 RepID=A0A7C9FIA7_OPUST
MSSFFRDVLLPILCADHFNAKFRAISGTLIQQFQEPMSCNSDSSELCRDDSAALNLKLVAIASIMVAGATGITIPLLGRRKSFLATDGNLFTAAKSFAAGVILATGFVHMLPDASENLTNECLPSRPWSKFPFAGFLAMMSALVTLLADFVGTQIYETKTEKMKSEKLGFDGLLDSASPAGVMPADRPPAGKGKDGKVVREEESIVGIHAHAGAHGHDHEAREGHVVEVYDHHDDDNGDGHGHSHRFDDGDTGARHTVVSQVLELGIVSHSVLIGLSLGVSHSPCTIRPLVAALSFHQFFEGFALGGCIAQAQFKQMSTAIMSCFFAFTTPGGIAAGIGLARFYNPSSPGALIVEGILDAISSGILIYMALVDLIAADFMSKKMRCNKRLQVVSYFALFLGASLMSSLAIWS